MDSADHSANASTRVRRARGRRACNRTSAIATSSTAAISSGTTLDVIGVEQRDHAQRADVVDDGQGQQEDPQPGRVLGPDDRQRADQERGVGGDHHTPGTCVRRRDGLNSRKTTAGTMSPAIAATTGTAARARSVSSPMANSTLHLQPDDEEEERHQTVVDEVPHGELGM